MFKFKKVFLFSFISLILTGCTQQAVKTERVELPAETIPSTSQTTNSAETATATPTLNQENPKTQVTALTKTELTKHATQKDCWLLIEGKVYDVTSYISNHPGGQTILAGCGKDATDLFATKGDKDKPHSSKAETLLQNYYLGKLITP